MLVILDDQGGDGIDRAGAIRVEWPADTGIGLFLRVGVVGRLRHGAKGRLCRLGNFL